MTRAFVSIGSNIEPADNVLKAMGLLAQEIPLLRISTVYRTEPIGGADQSPYYNCVVEVDARMQPLELKLTVLRAIEEMLGRKRSDDRFAPRTIDLDLIAYGDVAMKSRELTLPDPEIMNRPFLAIALAELAPEMILPGADMNMKEISARMSLSGIEALADYTERLRGNIHERD